MNTVITVMGQQWVIDSNLLLNFVRANGKTLDQDTRRENVQGDPRKLPDDTYVLHG